MNARDCVVGLVVEGPSDERTVRDLVGRILDVSPSFQGIAHGELFITWRAAATMRVPRRHGDFGKGPAKTEDAPATSNALQAFVGRETQPVAVVLLRDSDGKQDERMLAIKGECEARPWPFKILVGVPHTKQEELFHQVDLARLREHGARNGLADFMAEIEAKLCQL